MRAGSAINRLLSTKLLINSGKRSWIERVRDQEACLNAHQGLPKFIGRSIGEYGAWLKRICHNLLATAMRRLQCERGREEALDENALQQHGYGCRERTAEEVIAALEDAAILEDALNRLPAEEARIVVWRYFDRRTFTEIAERLRRTRRVVERAFHRAFGRLRAVVKQPTDGPLAAAVVHALSYSEGPAEASGVGARADV